MPSDWTPPLRISESGATCRLWLGSYAYGDGATLQEAADDLVKRLLSLATSVRCGGIRISPELGVPDLRWFELLYEVSEIAASGGDLRARLFARLRPAA